MCIRDKTIKLINDLFFINPIQPLAYCHLLSPPNTTTTDIMTHIVVNSLSASLVKINYQTNFCMFHHLQNILSSPFSYRLPLSQNQPLVSKHTCKNFEQVQIIKHFLHSFYTPKIPLSFSCGKPLLHIY